jgi:hypothetical protein
MDISKEWGSASIHWKNNMKTKTEQLEELKATAVKLQQQIEELEKPKQWEPRSGGYWVCAWGDVFCDDPVEDSRTSKFGVKRQTAKAAEKASAAMRTHNRLLAYVDEFGGDWEADWADLKKNKYYVQYYTQSKTWEMGSRCTVCVSGTVHMSRECAEGLVAKLNTGEVVL